jgi:hypothetical protein
MPDEAFGVICITGKQREQKRPVVTEIQIAVPPLFASFYKFLARAKTTRPFMSVPVTESSGAQPPFESYSVRMLLWRERSNNRFKARVASERVPKRIQPQIAVAQTGDRKLRPLSQLFDCAILVASPRIDNG